MLCARLLVFLTVCCVSFGKPPSSTTIEILTTDSDSMTARFRDARGVKKYFASVHIKDLMDVGADYTVKMKRADRQPDGYYHINATGKLQPGNRYEIWLVDRKNYRTLTRAEFFTDCDEYSFQCKTAYGEACVLPEELCDGYERCSDGEDEAIGEDGNCAVKIRARPTAPPPPPDAPCMVQMNEAIAAGRRSYLSCNQDGSYSAMHCTDEDSSHNCYCIDGSTGTKLFVKKRYDPFVHSNFLKRCERVRKSRASKRGSP